MLFDYQVLHGLTDAQRNFEQLQAFLRANGTFVAHAGTAAQLGSAAAPAKVAINTVDSDISTWFDTTNHRFTPQVTGYYQFLGSVISSAGLVAGDFLRLQVRQNGSVLSPAPLGDNSQQTNTTFAVEAQVVASPVFMNGSTDYVELWGVCISSAAAQVTTTFNAVFSGSFIGTIG